MGSVFKTTKCVKNGPQMIIIMITVSSLQTNEVSRVYLSVVVDVRGMNDEHPRTVQIPIDGPTIMPLLNDR